MLHELTGIPDPYKMQDDKPHEGNRTEDQAGGDDPTDGSKTGGEPDWGEPPPTEEAGEERRYMKIPELGRNVYETFWAELELTPEHRAELKKKRGMSDGWIDALGLVSATRSNLEKLMPLLEKFPEKELLKLGLAQRNNRSRQIEVAGVLHGKSWNADTKEYQYADNIIIPYIDGAGRIIGLRPHKRGLSTRDHRKEEVDEFYNKTSENLRIIYGEVFLHDRPKEWEHSCVICEGEFKASGVAQCGIPAIGFQGIEYFAQNKQSEQAIEATVKMLTQNKIREVVVVFDNEEKGDKPFFERFNAEIWARYTALVLEDHGIKALFGVLPESWRDAKGKADWDGRLAWHVAKARSHAAGVKAATDEFAKFLRHRNGDKALIRKAPRQMDFFADLKEDVIMQALNKLRHVSKVFVGGAYESEFASELTNWCHPKYKDRLAISKLAAALRETYGGYYKPKAPSEALEKRALEDLEEIDAVLDEHDKSVNLNETELRQYRVARKAAYTILYRFPKVFTDFTAESKYKVLCLEADGTHRLDRLVVFSDKNGRKSKSIQMAGDKLNSSQELRKFFPKVGSYHWWGNQEECDFWLQELDVQNYQRTITEIDTYGWNRDVGMYIMGDCAIANGKFIFPDKHGIIWHKGLGYKNSEGVVNGTSFCHKPPCLFPNAKDARIEHDAIDWNEEQREVAKIWQTLQRDFCDAFGSIAGLAAIGSMLQYMAHPELLRSIGGKPGFWVQGRKGSGKTKTVEAGMRIFGFPRNYEIVALGSTKVGIERNLSQFCGLPVHIDEWRNLRALEGIIGFITNAFNEIGISKGTMAGTKSTRKSKASTIPIVTGEDGATDPALRSRYLRLVMSAAQRHGTAIEQRARYFQMMENADSYYRVGRFLFKYREPFAADVVKRTKEFIDREETGRRISGDREQEVGGICLSAMLAANTIIDPDGAEFPQADALREFMLKHMSESCTDTTNDVFLVNFFADAVNMINRGVPHVEKYLRVVRGTVSEDGKINALKSIIGDTGKLVVLIAYRELYDEYMADKGKLRETAPIARSNIQAELKGEDAWMKFSVSPGTHRYRLYQKNGGRDILRAFWALDYEKLAPELKTVFRSIYERELEHEDHAITDDDSIVSIQELDLAERENLEPEPNPF